MKIHCVKCGVYGEHQFYWIPEIGNFKGQALFFCCKEHMESYKEFYHQWREKRFKHETGLFET